jgi:hypothetical protein
MNNRLIQAVLSCSALGLALSLHSRPAEAVIIGFETSDTLFFNFESLDAYPPGNSPGTNGPLVTLFDGQYWQVSAQSLAAPTGPATGSSSLFVQQVIPGQNAVPSAIFGLSLRSGGILPQQVSYQANSPAAVFDDVNCPLASDNCVFYELQSFTVNPDLSPYLLRYELRGFFEASDSSEPIPESSTVVGSLAALGLIAILQIKRRFV